MKRIPLMREREREKRYDTEASVGIAHDAYFIYHYLFNLLLFFIKRVLYLYHL